MNASRVEGSANEVGLDVELKSIMERDDVDVAVSEV